MIRRFMDPGGYFATLPPVQVAGGPECGLGHYRFGPKRRYPQGRAERFEARRRSGIWRGPRPLRCSEADGPGVSCKQQGICRTWARGAPQGSDTMASRLRSQPRPTSTVLPTKRPPEGGPAACFHVRPGRPHGPVMQTPGAWASSASPIVDFIL
jgi:hypothetical protein